LQLLINEQYNEITADREQYNTNKLAWKPQLRFQSHTTRRRAVCSRRSVLEAPRMDPRTWPAEPQDYKQECTEHVFTGVNSKSAWIAARLCNQAAQECTAAEQDTGVQWRSLCTMPITGVMVIKGDPSCGNIWVTGVCWKYL
jgi:hypothetical protein